MALDCVSRRFEVWAHWRTNIVPLNSPEDDALVQQYAGLGSSHNELFSQAAPLEHGERVTGLRLLPRIIQHTFRIYDDPFDIKKGRLQILFGAYHEPITLRYEVGPDRKQRYIDVYVTDMPDLPSSTIYMDEQGEDIQDFIVSFDAPDPLFYHPEKREVVWSLRSGAHTEVPTPIPTRVGPSRLKQAQAVEHRGTWNGYPVFGIRGPMRKLVIRNLLTGETIRFKDEWVLHGDTILELSTGLGKRLIDAATGISQAQWLVDEHDWNTWHLAGPKEAGQLSSPTFQNVEVEFEGGNQDSTQVVMQWNDRFISLWG